MSQLTQIQFQQNPGFSDEEDVEHSETLNHPQYEHPNFSDEEDFGNEEPSETLNHNQFPQNHEFSDEEDFEHSETLNHVQFQQDFSDGEDAGSIIQPYNNRKHVYANVWERSLDPRGTTGDELSSPDTWTIDWRQWPPDVPHFPAGLKIPVELIQNPLLGLMEAVPISSGTPSFFENMDGLLNTVQTSSIVVDPPALLFLRSQVGQFYSVKIRLKNIDSVPRKVNIFPPNNKCFKVNYGPNKAALPPGLTIPITVNFRPDSNQSVNDILFITVEGDGALTVPLVSATIPPPILEMDEWDCGCSVIATSRTEYFEIKNLGSPGRFWFLTEDEFRHEYLAFQEHEHKSIRKGCFAKHNNNSSNPKSPAMGNKNGQKGNTLYMTSFKIHPSCYKLQRNQRVNIKVKYTPRGAGLHYEKIAVFCDNGEVRWIAIKGIGIDIRSKGLIELRAEPFWTGPPVDIQSDFNCRYSIDFGDLLSGDGGKMEFTAINRSCIPLYFFWSVRPLSLDTDNEEPMGNISFQKFLEGSLEPLEWDDYSKHSHDGIKSNDPKVDVKICPSQGILRQRQEIGFTLSAPCPKTMLGYYGCVISLFVEQVDEESISIITPYVKGLDNKKTNDVPMHIDDLRRTMPSNHEVRPKVIEISKGYRGDGDGDIGETSSKVYMLKQGHHGPDKLKLLKTRGVQGDSKKSPRQNHKPPVQSTGTIEEPKTKDSGRKAGGEFIPGVDKPEELHLVKDDNLHGKHDIRRTSPTMDELKTYTEFADVPPPKTWLKNAALLPIAEVEVWLRSVPLNVQFHPPFIVASGVTMSQTERTMNVFNASAWTVEVTWQDMIDDTACLSCAPAEFVLEPQQNYEFKVTILFDKSGKICKDLKGLVRVKDSKMQTPCSIPCSLVTTGPFIKTLTPILNFGVMRINTEKMKTLAIQNTGNDSAQWVASVNAEGLIDEQNHNISPFNQNLEGLKLLRVWPTWGILEPDETLGINVYFSGEIPGEIAASVKIVVEGIPESALYIPILAEVQSPFLVLEEGEIKISREEMSDNKITDTTVTLINPTGFPINFGWQSCLIGRQCQLVTAEFFPPAGYVPPRGTMDCVLTMSTSIDTTLRNCYALCTVETMKEPLILKISSD